MVKSMQASPQFLLCNMNTTNAVVEAIHSLHITWNLIAGRSQSLAVLQYVSQWYSSHSSGLWYCSSFSQSPRSCNFILGRLHFSLSAVTVFHVLWSLSPHCCEWLAVCMYLKKLDSGSALVWLTCSYRYNRSKLAFHKDTITSNRALSKGRKSNI